MEPQSAPPPSANASTNYANTANALIQQITEPAAVNVLNVNVVKPNPTPQAIPAATNNFVDEITSMLYGFGDSRRPKIETAILVDEIVRKQMTEILTKAIEVSYQRGSHGTVGVEDIAFLMRKNPLKVQSLYRHLSIKDMAGNVNVTGAPSSDIYGIINQSDNRRAKRCKEFLLSIDNEGGLLSQALNDELHDEMRTERLKRLDRLSRDMDERRYAEFTRARQVSFLGHNMKFASKFHDWVLSGLKSCDPLIEEDNNFSSNPNSIERNVKMDRSGLETLAYLAYETVGYIVEMALLVRRDSEAGYSNDHGQGLESFGMDPVMRHFTPIAYNTQFPMIQQPLTSADDDQRRMLNSKEEDSVCTRPIEPSHIREVLRRLVQRPKPFQMFSRVQKSYASTTLMPLIAIQ